MSTQRYTAQDLFDELKNTTKRATLKDLVVCVPNNRVGIGGTSVSFVKIASRGIDWDSRKFIIWPEDKLQIADQEPVKSIEWKTKSKEWAEKQMVAEFGEAWDRENADYLNRYYAFIFMFITDCFHFYHKY